ncbi:MAG: ABC transporter permease [Chloroflexi bacterium]|nr:ABC transporter permease [Chloroflexota bacterium]MDA1004426.1 ABC transporter permease [Chloroflexota bacterium]
MTAEQATALATERPPRARPRRPRWLTAPVLIGLSVLLFWLLVAITIPVWAPADPLEPVADRLAAPTLGHPLGTDNLGRDVLSRTLYGARTALPVATMVIAGALVVGCVIGAISGFAGGWVDAVLMRFVDMTLAFPAILLAMTVTAYLGRDIRNIVIGIIAVAWPGYARLLRGQVLAIRRLDHVEAAIALGGSRSRVLLRHVLPLAISPIIVAATMDFGGVILLIASLSFIGLGAKPPTPEWGVMITDGARFFYQWWIAAGPGIAIFTVVLGANFVGDGLRDVLDPRTRQG